MNYAFLYTQRRAVQTEILILRDIYRKRQISEKHQEFLPGHLLSLLSDSDLNKKFKHLFKFAIFDYVL